MIESSKNFIKELNFESVQEFINTLCDRDFSTATESIFTPNRWIFRGAANSEWTLQPTALRENIRGKLLFHAGRSSVPLGNLETTQIFSEYILLYRFYKQLERSGLEVPDNSPKLRDFFSHPTRLASFLYKLSKESSLSWPPPEISGLMALAQHYGLPTRLLDWTFDPLIACYFSARHSDASRLAVWCLDTSTLSVEKFDTTLIFAAAASNQNLHAQQGLFTLSKVEFSDGNYAKELDSRPLEERFGQINTVTNRPSLIKITLPRSQSENLRCKLNNLGCTTSKVFPGYKGIVDEINEGGGFVEKSGCELYGNFDCSVHVFVPEEIASLGNAIAALVDPDIGGYKSFDAVKLCDVENPWIRFRYCGGQIGKESLAYLLQDLVKSIRGVRYYISGGNDPFIFSSNIDGVNESGESLVTLAGKLGIARI